MKRIFLLAAFFMACSSFAQNFSIYGLTSYGGTFSDGAMFRYDYPLGNYSIVLNFNGTNGKNPTNSLLYAPNGYIYSMVSFGGSFSKGVFYRFNPKTNKDSVFISFSGSNGSTPYGGLMQAANGLLYGTASAGGTYNKGILFSFDTASNAENVLYSFNDTNGATPVTKPLQAANGKLYGTATGGGSNNMGVLYCYNPVTLKDSVVINFNGPLGSWPLVTMVASNMSIYGVTKLGGTNGVGVLYAYNPFTGSDSVKVNFGGAIGSSPHDILLQSSNGLIYGMTERGGTYNGGTIFSYNITTNIITTLYSFHPGGADGAYPFGNGFIEGTNGLLYTCIDSGATNNMGALINFNMLTNRDSILVTFSPTNGYLPRGDMIMINHSTAGINELSGNNCAEIFPNPSHGKFFVKTPVSMPPAGVEIYDMLGEKVLTIHLSGIGNLAQIDLSNFTAGIYLYRIITETGYQVKEGKLVIE